jgi:hypothetical protein
VNDQELEKRLAEIREYAGDDSGTEEVREILADTRFLLAELDRATPERDELGKAVERLARERDQIHQASINAHRERDAAIARAEQYERDAREWMEQRGAALADLARLREAILHFAMCNGNPGDGSTYQQQVEELVAAADPAGRKHVTALDAGLTRIQDLEAECAGLRGALVEANRKISDSEQFAEGHRDGWRKAAESMRERAAKVAEDAPVPVCVDCRERIAAAIRAMPVEER